MSTPQSAPSTRTRQIRTIKAMCRELALADDCYRDIIARHSGGRTRSSAEMTDDERDAVIAYLRGLGAGKRAAGKTGGARFRALAASAEARKIRVLWLALWHLGEIPDASEAALAGFVKRQAKVDALQWISPEQLSSVIDALKDRGWRAGFYVEATDGNADKIQEAKIELVIAIWRRLHAMGAVKNRDRHALDVWLQGRIKPHKTSVRLLSGPELDAAAAALGAWLRTEMKRRGFSVPLSVNTQRVEKNDEA